MNNILNKTRSNTYYTPMCNEKKQVQVMRWRHNHPENVRQYNKQYYERNKERLRQERRERYQVEKALTAVM